MSQPKQLRILIIRNAYQKDTGGAEQYSFNLALALNKLGHKPYLVTNQKQIIARCQKENIKHIRAKWHESQVWGKHYYVRFPLMILWYMWVIITRHINVIHPQGRDDFVFATTAGWLMRKKVIWTDHADLKYIMDRINHRHPRMQAWILSAAKRCNHIICVSHTEKEKILKVAPELADKLIVIHNGVFLPHANPIKKDNFVVGASSRLVKDKGIAELIEGFAQAKKLPKTAQLWIIGGHSGNLEFYQALAGKLGIKNRVKFIGYVTNPNDYVAAFDIFVHPSYHEAFSLAIVEACMIGKPVISTKVGGATEILDKNSAILIEPESAGDIRESIDYLIDNPGFMNKIAKNAKQRAVKDFDFEKIVQNQIIKLYEQ